MEWNIIEVAAWLIVGQAGAKLLWGSRDEKKLSLEKEAVKIEFNDLEGKADDAERQSNRAMVTFYRRRQERLLLRYPQHLVPAPELQYFSAAIKTSKAHPSRLNASDKLAVGAMWAFWALIAFGISTLLHC